MWKPFNNSGKLYMIRLDQGENELTLLLTDFLVIWESLFSIETLVLDFKKVNPRIAATDSQIQTDLIRVIDDLQNVKVSVSNLDDGSVELSLEQSCKLGDCVESQSILYTFLLSKKIQDEFKDKVTVSAIQTIYFLERQQKMLLNLVQRKDRELEEYKMEKGEISRGDLKTDKFNPESVKVNNDKLFLNVFTSDNSQGFWKKFTEKNGEVQPTSINVVAEPWNAVSRKRVIHSSKNVVKRGSGVTYKK